jgi:RNA polymerase sigma-70 factor (ECF subfamily)
MKEIFERTKDDLFHLIRARVGEREDALDIFQEVYVEFWKALQSKSFVYRSDPELLGFLYVIAKRRIAKFYRFRRLTLSLDDLEIGLEDKAETEDKVLLLTAIEKLNELDREVVRLHYFSGLGFKEIGSLLNRGENAIKVRHHRAISRLKEILGYDPST